MLDSIEDEAEAGGCLIDFHTCDMFPESWIDLVVVLQTDHTTLWNRLEARYTNWLLVLTEGDIRYRRSRRITKLK